MRDLCDTLRLVFLHFGILIQLNFWRFYSGKHLIFVSMSDLAFGIILRKNTSGSAKYGRNGCMTNPFLHAWCILQKDFLSYQDFKKWIRLILLEGVKNNSHTLFDNGDRFLLFYYFNEVSLKTFSPIHHRHQRASFTLRIDWSLDVLMK